MLSHRPRTQRGGRSTRRGFTLSELLVAMVLLGLVLTTLTSVIMQQQRFYHGTSQVLETRANVRQVADILPSELRAISPSSGDIYAMTGTSIDYRGSTGAAVVCTINGPRTIITIPPLATASQNGTTAWLSLPQPGDSILVYDQGATPASADDAWQAHALTLSPVAGVCTQYTANTVEAALGFTLTLNTPLSATVLPGASIRFFRRARYELYNGSDGLGYLGFSDCLATRSPQCSSPQPVSGPYLPFGGTPQGMGFTYRDSTGAVTATPAQVSRIDVVVRSRTRSNVRMAGYGTGKYSDSLTFSIAARN